MDINYTTRVNLRFNLIFVFLPTDKYSNILSKKMFFAIDRDHFSKTHLIKMLSCGAQFQHTFLQHSLYTSESEVTVEETAGRLQAWEE